MVKPDFREFQERWSLKNVVAQSAAYESEGLIEKLSDSLAASWYIVVHCGEHAKVWLAIDLENHRSVRS